MACTIATSDISLFGVGSSSQIPPGLEDDMLLSEAQNPKSAGLGSRGRGCSKACWGQAGEHPTSLVGWLAAAHHEETFSTHPGSQG